MEILDRMHRYDLHLLTRIFGQGKRPTAIPTAKGLSRSREGYLHVLFPALLRELHAPGWHALLRLLMPAILIERVR